MKKNEGEWEEAMTSLLGKKVKVVLAEDDPTAIAIGTLLSFTDDGSVVVLDDAGTKHFCLPNLETVEMPR